MMIKNWSLQGIILALLFAASCSRTGRNQFGVMMIQIVIVLKYVKTAFVLKWMASQLANHQNV